MTNAEAVVKLLRPGAYSRMLGMPNSPVVEWEIVEKILWTHGTTTSYKSLGRCLPSEDATWHSALISLVQSDPEAVVKAVYPDAFINGQQYGFDLYDKPTPGYVYSSHIGSGDTPEAAWLSAASRICIELKGKG